MLHLLYTALAAQIQTLPPAAVQYTQGGQPPTGAAGLWIDLWNNQLQDPDRYPPYMPAIFIEYTEIQWSKMSNGVKKGNCTLRIHIGQANYAATAYTPDGQPLPYQTDALHVLAFINEVNATLETFSIAPQPNVLWGITPLLHQATITDHDHDDYVYHHILEYTTTILDETLAALPTGSSIVTITDADVQPNTVPPPAPQPDTPYII